jgi:hypothetical protein
MMNTTKHKTLMETEIERGIELKREIARLRTELENRKIDADIERKAHLATVKMFTEMVTEIKANWKADREELLRGLHLSENDNELQEEEIAELKAQLASDERKAAEKLCEIYFNIAAEVIGEDEVRRKRMAVIDKVKLAAKLDKIEKGTFAAKDVGFTHPMCNCEKRMRWSDEDPCYICEDCEATAH